MSLLAILLGLAIVAFLAVVLGVTDPSIPTPQDTQLLIQDTVTKTATFNSTSLDLGSGRAPGGVGMPVAAVVNVSALDTADGNETYSLKLQESTDDSTYTDAGAALLITATGVVLLKGRLTKRYVRVAGTLAGTTPSITFKAWLNPLP